MESEPNLGQGRRAKMLDLCTARSSPRPTRQVGVQDQMLSWRMRRFYTTTVVAALLVSSCDPIYGVQTVAKLPGPVNANCVDQAIRATPEVGDVVFKQTQSESFEIAPHWGHVTTISKYWTYGSNGAVILQIHESRHGTDLENGFTRLGVPVPDDQITAYLPLVRRVNLSVETMCGIPSTSIGSLKRL